VSWTKAFKIIGSWLGFAATVILFMFWSSPLAGAALALVFLAAVLVIIGSPAHIFLVYRKPHRSNIGAFLQSLLLVFLCFIFVAASGVFNFT